MRNMIGISLIVFVVSCVSKESENSTTSLHGNGSSLSKENISVSFPRQSLDVLVNHFFLQNIIVNGVAYKIISSKYCFDESQPQYLLFATDNMEASVSQEFLPDFACGRPNDIALLLRNKVRSRTARYMVAKANIESDPSGLKVIITSTSKFQRRQRPQDQNQRIEIGGFSFQNLRIDIAQKTIFDSVHFSFFENGGILSEQITSSSDELLGDIESEAQPTFTAALAGDIISVNAAIDTMQFDVSNDAVRGGKATNSKFEVSSGKLYFVTRVSFNHRVLNVRVELSESFAIESSEVLFINRDCQAGETAGQCSARNLQAEALRQALENYLSSRIDKPFLEIPPTSIHVRSDAIDKQLHWKLYRSIRSDSTLIMLGTLTQ